MKVLKPLPTEFPPISLLQNMLTLLILYDEYPYMVPIPRMRVICKWQLTWLYTQFSNMKMEYTITEIEKRE